MQYLPSSWSPLSPTSSSSQPRRNTVTAVETQPESNRDIKNDDALTKKTEKQHSGSLPHARAPSAELLKSRYAPRAGDQPSRVGNAEGKGGGSGRGAARGRQSAGRNTRLTAASPNSDKNATAQDQVAKIAIETRRNSNTSASSVGGSSRPRWSWSFRNNSAVPTFPTQNVSHTRTASSPTIARPSSIDSSRSNGTSPTTPPRFIERVRMKSSPSAPTLSGVGRLGVRRSSAGSRGNAQPKGVDTSMDATRENGGDSRPRSSLSSPQRSFSGSGKAVHWYPTAQDLAGMGEIEPMTASIHDGASSDEEEYVDMDTAPSTPHPDFHDPKEKEEKAAHTAPNTSKGAISPKTPDDGPTIKLEDHLPTEPEVFEEDDEDGDETERENGKTHKRNISVIRISDVKPNVTRGNSGSMNGHKGPQDQKPQTEQHQTHDLLASPPSRNEEGLAVAPSIEYQGQPLQTANNAHSNSPPATEDHPTDTTGAEPTPSVASLAAQLLTITTLLQQNSTKFDDFSSFQQEQSLNAYPPSPPPLPSLRSLTDEDLLFKELRTIGLTVASNSQAIAELKKGQVKLMSVCEELGKTLKELNTKSGSTIDSTAVDVKEMKPKKRKASSNDDSKTSPKLVVPTEGRLSADDIVPKPLKSAIKQSKPVNEEIEKVAKLALKDVKVTVDKVVPAAAPVAKDKKNGEAEEKITKPEVVKSNSIVKDEATTPSKPKAFENPSGNDPTTKTRRSDSKKLDDESIITSKPKAKEKIGEVGAVPKAKNRQSNISDTTTVVTPPSKPKDPYSKPNKNHESVSPPKVDKNADSIPPSKPITRPKTSSEKPKANEKKPATAVKFALAPDPVPIVKSEWDGLEIRKPPRKVGRKVIGYVYEREDESSTSESTIKGRKVAAPRG